MLCKVTPTPLGWWWWRWPSWWPQHVGGNADYSIKNYVAACAIVGYFS